MTLYVYQNNTAKQVNDVRIKANDTWNSVNEIWTKVGSDWKKAFYKAYSSNVYIGGEFTSQGINVSNFSAINKTNSIVNQNIVPNFSTNSQIKCIVKDGISVYIGGFFTSINNIPRNGLANIDLGGNVSSFNINLAVGYVFTILKYNNTIYIGGYLGGIPGYSNRSYSMALNTNGDIIPAWDLQTNDTVYSLVKDPNYDLLYVGGQFSSIKTDSLWRLSCCCVEMSGTGNVRDFDPGCSNGPVNNMVVLNNSLYVCGNVQNVKMYKIFRIASIDKTTGLINPKFRPVCNNTLRTIIHDTDTIYFGGDFTSVNSTTRAYAASVDKNGNLLPWDPSADTTINKLLKYNNRIYLAGTFTSLKTNTYQQAGLAAVESSGSGNFISSFAPVILATPGYRTRNKLRSVKDIIINNNILYVGGLFNYINSEYILNTGSIDVNTGLINYYSGNNSQITNSIVASPSGIYVGGFFDRAKCIYRSSMCGLLKDYKTINSFSSDVSTYINCIVKSNNFLYIGGSFTYVNNTLQYYTASLNLSGSLLPWNPNPNATINTMIASGSNIYLGGNFSYLGGYSYSRNYAAAVDTSGIGNILLWNPDLNGSVSSMTKSSSAIYIGGNFTYVNGNTIPRNSIAGFGMSGSGKLLPWNPNCNGSINVMTSDSSGIYFGGNFTTVNSKTRNNAAAVDMCGTGNLLAWNPNCDYTVKAIQKVGNTIYIGGSFSNVGGNPKGRFAITNLSGGTTSWDPQFNGDVNAMTVDGSAIYIGGYFTTCISGNANYFKVFNTRGAVISDSSLNFDAVVYSINLFDNNIIYIGGDFSILNGTTRNNAYSMNLSGSLSAWDPSFNSSIYSLYYDNVKNTIYNVGQFSQVNTNTNLVIRNYFSEVDATSGTVTSLVYNLNNYGSVITKDSDNYYLGGSFNSINGILRTCIGSINPSGGVLDFNPNSGGAINCIDIDSNNMYIGGELTNIGGFPRGFVAAFNTSGNGDVLPFNPNANSTVNTIASNISANVLYMGGSFSAIGSTNRYGFAAVDLSGGNLQDIYNTNLTNYVYSITVTPSSVIIGGDFYDNNTNKRSLEEFDLNGNITTLDCSFNGTAKILSLSYDNSTNQIFYGGNNVLLANGISRNYFSAINKETNSSIDYGMSIIGYGGSITAITKNNNYIYFGGNFNTVNSIPRSCAAGLNIASSGSGSTLLPWNPSFINYVYSMVKCISGIYIGGNFTSVNSDQPSPINQQNLCIVDTMSGAMLPWYPNINGQVNAITYDSSSNKIYAGGNFSQINGVSRNFAGAVYGIYTQNSTITGGQLVQGWDPNFSNSVYTILFDDNIVYIGGSFYYAKNYSIICGTVCSFDISGNYLGWNPGIGANVYSLDSDENYIYIGGEFTNVQTVSNLKNCIRMSKATYDTYDKGTIDYNWTPIVDAAVRSLKVDYNYVFLGGDFTSVNNSEHASKSFVCVDKLTGIENTNFNFGFSGGTNSVKTLYVDKSQLVAPVSNQDNSTIYYMGSTSSFLEYTGIQISNHPVQFDYNYRKKMIQAVSENGTKFKWFNGPTFDVHHYGYYMADGEVYAEYPPSIDCIYKDPDPISNTVYVGGLFVDGIFSMDMSGNKNTWNPHVKKSGLRNVGNNESVATIIKDSNNIYFGGVFDSVGGIKRYNAAAVDISANVLSWDPGCFTPKIEYAYNTDKIIDGTSLMVTVGGKVNTMYKRNNNVYIGGEFDTFNYSSNPLWPNESAQSLGLVMVDSISGGGIIIYESMDVGDGRLSSINSVVTMDYYPNTNLLFFGGYFAGGIHSFNILTTVSDYISAGVGISCLDADTGILNKNFKRVIFDDVNHYEPSEVYKLHIFNNNLYMNCGCTKNYNITGAIDNSFFGVLDIPSNNFTPYYLDFFNKNTDFTKNNNTDLYYARTYTNSGTQFKNGFIGNSLTKEGYMGNTWMPTYPNTMPYITDEYSITNIIPLMFNTIEKVTTAPSSSCPYSVSIKNITGSNKYYNTNINTISVSPNITGGDLVTSIIYLPDGWTSSQTLYSWDNINIGPTPLIFTPYNYGVKTITAVTSSIFYPSPNIQYINYYVST